MVSPGSCGRDTSGRRAGEYCRRDAEREGLRSGPGVNTDRGSHQPHGWARVADGDRPRYHHPVVRGGERIELSSDVGARCGPSYPSRSTTPPRWAPDPDAYTSPVWWRSCAPRWGPRGAVATNLPVGGGLSSSTALEVAVALALGAVGRGRDPLALARLCPHAEHRRGSCLRGAWMKLTCVARRGGARTVRSTSSPRRGGRCRCRSSTRCMWCTAACTAGSTRRATMTAAGVHDRGIREIGPLGVAADRRTSARSVIRVGGGSYARHVVTENARVHAMIHTLANERHGDRRCAISSSPQPPQPARRLRGVGARRWTRGRTARRATPGGWRGARMTGGGFGGCAVVFAVRTPTSRASAAGGCGPARVRLEPTGRAGSSAS